MVRACRALLLLRLLDCGSHRPSRKVELSRKRLRMWDRKLHARSLPAKCGPASCPYSISPAGGEKKGSAGNDRQLPRCTAGSPAATRENACGGACEWPESRLHSTPCCRKRNSRWSRKRRGPANQLHRITNQLRLMSIGRKNQVRDAARLNTQPRRVLGLQEFVDAFEVGIELEPVPVR